MELQPFSFTADSHKLADYLNALGITLRDGLHRIVLKNQVVKVDNLGEGVEVHSRYTFGSHDIKGSSLMALGKVLSKAPHQPVTISMDGFAIIDKLTV